MTTESAPTEMLSISLFKDSRGPFMALLVEHGVPHEEVMLKANTPMASGFLVDILQGSGPWAAALAAVVCAFLKNRRSRKVIITTKDNVVVHCEGLGQAEVEQTLKRAKRITAIQTEKDEI
jgi:hypothetical protein